MLADDDAVGSAVLHAGGVIESMPRGATHISMSTISVDAFRGSMAERHGKRGQHYIAAPVFGRPDAAEAGKLFIAAAGAKDVVERLHAGAGGAVASGCSSSAKSPRWPTW